MNNVNDRAPTAPSPISGSKPFMWRTVGAKVKPFSESAKSIESFFRADAQEKARRLILPLKKESRRARRNNSSINRAAIAFAVTKVRLFSLQTNLSKSFLNRFDKKKQPPKKRTPSQERQKKKHIYNIVRARKRDPKGAQKKQNEKRKKILRKKTFQSQKGGRLRKEEDTKGREG
ncbi:hypothetical protein PGA7_00019420 [Porphyromonas gingivalis]|nr:hypothetical protein PGA7_00019420 [Porphyromonas gingivalis]